jgi:hypothetical protein
MFCVQGNCTDAPPIFNPPLRSNFRPLLPLQCVLVCDRSVITLWQPGSALLENLYFRAEHKSVDNISDVTLVSNVPGTLTIEPVRLFMISVTLQGDAQPSSGLRVAAGGRAFVDSAPPPPVCFLFSSPSPLFRNLAPQDVRANAGKRRLWL